MKFIKDNLNPSLVLLLAVGLSGFVACSKFEVKDAKKEAVKAQVNQVIDTGAAGLGELRYTLKNSQNDSLDLSFMPVQYTTREQGVACFKEGEKNVVVFFDNLGGMNIFKFWGQELNDSYAVTFSRDEFGAGAVQTEAISSVVNLPAVSMYAAPTFGSISYNLPHDNSFFCEVLASRSGTTVNGAIECEYIPLASFTAGNAQSTHYEFTDISGDFSCEGL